jgi:hypothetical protein
MNSNTRIAATRCFLGTWFVSGILSVDTLHKGDTDNNNNNNKQRCRTVNLHVACTGALGLDAGSVG